MNIESDTGDSLYSGGEEGGGCLYVSVYDDKFDPSAGTKHATNIFRVTSTSIDTNESSCPFYLVGLETDGGGDKHVQNNIALFGPFILVNMDKLNVTRVCPVIYFSIHPRGPWLC